MDMLGLAVRESAERLGRKEVALLIGHASASAPSA
jgi:hypothetical protein